MKLFGWIVVLSMCLGLNFKSTAQDYDQRSSLVEAKALALQTQINERLGRLSKSPFLTSDTGKSDSNEREASPLFQVYGTNKSRLLHAGELVYGKLLTQLIVGSEPSPALVKLNLNQGAVSGLRAIANARQGSVEGRVELIFLKLVLRSGNAVDIKATGLDFYGAEGLKAKVFSAKALAIAGALGSSFVSGLAVGSQSQRTNAFGFTDTPVNGKNAVLQGLAQTAADQSKRLIEESTKEKPVLFLESGAEVSLLIEEELRI